MLRQWNMGCNNIIRPKKKKCLVSSYMSKIFWVGRMENFFFYKVFFKLPYKVLQTQFLHRILLTNLSLFIVDAVFCNMFMNCVESSKLLITSFPSLLHGLYQ